MVKKVLHHIHAQPVGQRIIKTCIAVTLCMLFYVIRGYQSSDIPAEAAITAIICMSTNIRGTRENAASRFMGTLIGAFWGFLFLVVVPLFPELEQYRWSLYLLMGAGTMLALYSAVMLRKADAAGLAAIVFICVVVNYPEVESPMEQAFRRILDVLVGTTIAIVINSIRLPRKKLKNRVFFVKLRDLAVDQFASLPPAVLYRLEALLSDGAKICLVSEHAPAFQASQIGNLTFSVPMIVMDGAALYDANENVYLSITSLDPASSKWLMKRLESMDVSFFIYTVHRDRNCIFHHGTLTEAENIVYQQVKRSPYRYYLDNDHFTMADVVYIKIVGEEKELNQIKNQLQPAFDKMKIRAEIREQAGLENGRSLYFYAASATQEHAQKQLMHMLNQKEPGLEPHILVSRKGYRSENDAIRLMKKLRREYEPFILSYWLRKKDKNQETAPEKLPENVVSEQTAVPEESSDSLQHPEEK